MENKPPAEKNETKLLNIMIPEELLERLQTFCAEKEITVQDFRNNCPGFYDRCHNRKIRTCTQREEKKTTTVTRSKI
jgi:hypothetical protein